MTSIALSKDEVFNLLGFNGDIASKSCVPFFFELTRITSPSQPSVDSCVIGKNEDPFLVSDVQK
jgi:hypothetical protein